MFLTLLIFFSFIFSNPCSLSSISLVSFFPFSSLRLPSPSVLQYVFFNFPSLLSLFLTFISSPFPSPFHLSFLAINPSFFFLSLSQLCFILAPFHVSLFLSSHCSLFLHHLLFLPFPLLFTPFSTFVNFSYLSQVSRVSLLSS